MVSFTTVATASLVAVAALIEPTLGAFAAARVGASLVGSAISGSSSHHKRDENQGEKQLESNFATCLNNLHNNIPTMTYNADKSVDMGNLPPQCMDEVAAYNNQSNSDAFAATHGRIIIKGPAAIHIDQLPDDLHTFLEQKLGKPGANSSTPAQPSATH